MPTVRQSAIEDIAGRNAELEAEVQSYADDLAEVKLENLELKSHISRLTGDLDAALAELSRIRAAYPDVV